MRDLLEALPTSLPFYHLGVIEAAAETSSDAAEPTLTASDDRLAIAYSLAGDVSGSLVLLLESSLDVSTYSEAGNVIASRLATRLSDERGMDVVIGPPRVLARNQLARLPQGWAKYYRHGAHRLEVRLLYA